MDYSPTVRGRRLMREVIRLRQQAGLSMDAPRSAWTGARASCTGSKRAGPGSRPMTWKTCSTFTASVPQTARR